MVLKPEVARERLKAWTVEGADEYEPGVDRSRFHDMIGKLPAPLARVAFGLRGLDEKGNEPDSMSRNGLNASKTAAAAAAEFDKLSTPQRIRILQATFPRLAPDIERTWVAMRSSPYQSGWQPKAFRAPQRADVSLALRREWLAEMFHLAETFHEETLEPTWLAAWAPNLKSGWQSWEPAIGRLLAAAIDAGGKVGDEVFDILRQSLCNEHEIGSMGRHVVIGLLMSSRSEGWELIEKTLIAAQRQEGLRQAILEAIDLAHPTAFRRMLRLIQEHDLARFSAVARAVNVWFGFAWDSASLKVINGIIETAVTMLDDSAARERAWKGNDPHAAFMALWAVAFEDAPASIGPAEKLLKHKAVEMRYIATTHLSHLNLPSAESAGRKAIDDEDLRVSCRALGVLSTPDAHGEWNSDDRETLEDAFEQVEKLFHRLPAKPVVFKPIVWPWTDGKVSQELLAPLLVEHLGNRPPTRLLPYLGVMDPRHRRSVAELFGKQKKWDPRTRQSLIELAGDSSADVRAAAFTGLMKLTLISAEIDQLLLLLARKAADLRIGVTGLVMQQKDSQVLACADALLASKDGNQRLAALELLRQMCDQNRAVDESRQRAAEFRDQSRKINKEEQRQLDAILTAKPATAALTLDNALGLMDPLGRTPVERPRSPKAKLITPAAIACLKELDELVHKHRETPIVTNSRTQETELLGTIRWSFPSPEWRKSPESQATRLPLHEVWEAWFAGRSKATRDADGCELLRANLWREYALDWGFSDWQKWVKRKPWRKAMLAPLDAEKPIKLRYQLVVNQLLDWLLFLHPPKSQNEFLLDAVETLTAAIPAEELQALSARAAAARAGKSEDADDDPWYGTDWRDSGYLHDWLNPLIGNRLNLTKQQQLRRWRIGRWLDEPIAGATRNRPSSDWLFEAYAAGFANLHDIADEFLGPRGAASYGPDPFDMLEFLTKRRLESGYQKFLEEHPEVRELVERARSVVLETELQRGEAPTAASLAAQSLCSLIGIDTLVRLMQTLGKAGFKPATGWRFETKLQRPQTLTHLASITYPATNETPDEFAKRMRAEVAANSFPEERLIELAFLAPQWSRFVEAYFNWDGLAEGLYWFLAHMRFMWGSDAVDQAAESAGVAGTDDGEADTEPDDSDEMAEAKPEKLSAWERLIRERTALTSQDRTDGAIDVMWFQRVYAALGDKRWQKLAQAAKFASNAAQAKRAQLIADVLLGQAKLTDLIAGIEKKFLKENVRLIGMYPLPEGSKREPELARRFKILQEYGRYAKKLSGLTKPQALRALEIGLKNLASTAGYADALRLDWALGVSQWADLHKGPVGVTKDGLTVTLSIDDQVQPCIVVLRGDKELKSVPAALKKKHAQVAELFERGRELKRSASRQKQALEAAMCRGDEFSAGELLQLCKHALVAPFLKRLVLVGDGVMGYPDKEGKVLRNHAGKLEPIKKNEQLRIAHPHDLLAAGSWSQWQRDCFQAERMQPFKQIFRELYVVTKPEKSTGDHSQRFAGQQVNPSQALALWGQRGWDTGDGVFKVFHHLGIVASVTFNHGVSTPLEVEGLTLESVVFTKRNEFRPLKLTNVPPQLFSEVMRDMDLVVSVAHRGGVDPEATASTVEMRSALVRETCQLLGLKNVRQKAAHVLVDGKLSNYSIHLGSGTVQRMPGGALCVVPVHAQHRGRLFLPFADDDPRSAEILSKVLLFANDHEIQDPGILEQLRA